MPESLFGNENYPYQDWVVLPPGNRLLLRRPHPLIPPWAQQARVSDILLANFGAPFPWGHLPHPSPHDRLWSEHRLGNGGLYHEKWFVCEGGRVGGARNVLDSQTGALRYCLYLDGGSSEEGLAENEGLAIVCESDAATRDMYRRVMLHAAKHVMADRGVLVITPVTPEGIVHIGFGGRCRSCPNPLLITINQLQEAVPQYTFKPLPEWEAIYR